MDIPRFFVNDNQIQDQLFELTNLDDIKKIKKILRLNINDKIILITQNHKQYLGKINLVEQKVVSGNIVKEVKGNNFKKVIPKIILAQALTRAGKLDGIIKSNTELGIEEFIFFESRFSVFRLKNFKASKLNRWQKIAKEATRQSEQNKIPNIKSPVKFQDLMRLQIDLKLLFVARKNKYSTNLNSLKKELSSFKDILITIGPEGGFSDDEIDLAKKSGFKIITLSFPILRTETAGIVASAIIINYINTK